MAANKISDPTPGPSTAVAQSASEKDVKDDQGLLVIQGVDIEPFRKRGYQIFDILGAGSYAKVYSANYTDPAIPGSRKIKLACKVVDTNKSSKDFAVKFFPREISIISKVNHPNIVRAHSILKRGPKHFIFFILCGNGDLHAFLRDNGAIREERARIWFAQMLDAMAYLHKMNIVHRDLKCENILITDEMTVKISDFGFARTYREFQDISKTYCGSLMYCAPEILQGKPYNPKLSDLWSLGVILFVMINRSLPFEDKNLKKLYDQQINKKWHVRRKIKDQITSEVKAFLNTLLEPDPEKRRTITQLQRDPWFLKTILLQPRTITPTQSRVKVGTTPPQLPPKEGENSSSSSGNLFKSKS